MKGYKTQCPYCGHIAKTRSSHQVSPLLRHAKFMCTNPMCGATFGGYIEIAYVISPSAIHNPEVSLKKSNSKRCK